MTNEDRAGSDQTEQASSVTATEECECRKNISESLHWMKTCNVGAGTFKTGWDDAIDAALAFLGKTGAPCPCVGVAALNERNSLRAELAEEKRLRENDQQYALQMHHTICEYENAGGSGKYTVACAERDDARRLLDEAREALGSFADVWLRRPVFDVIKPFRVLCDIGEQGSWERAAAVVAKIDAARKPEA